MDDDAIIDLYFARDERAILETRLKYGGYCRSIAYNLLASADDSEECCSDALHAVWERIPPDMPHNLRCYIGRITRNIAVSRYRSEHAKKRSFPVCMLLSELGECLPADNSIERALDAQELTACLNEWLSGLSKDERALFVLRFWHGFSVAELAQRTAESPERISRTLYRLKKKLKYHLTEKGVKL